MASRARLGVLVAGGAIMLGGGLVIAGHSDDPAPASPPAPTATATPPPAPPATPIPLAGAPLHVDPAGSAADQVRAWEQSGRTADAEVLRRIADRPVATWFADANPGFAERARAVAADALRAGRLPVFTLYHIPGRDCGGQSSGGAQDADAYKIWIEALTTALRDHRAVIVLEPDAVAHAVEGCLDADETRERYALLKHAVDTLREVPGVLVYLDAGNPTWIRDPSRMATGLRKAGIKHAHGFALNVANFETTGDNVGYGTKLSRHLGRKHFVVDTSRNGNGPAQIGAGDRHWCNPPGRKLGDPPSTDTGNPLVDAYLWIKRPGESDGACSGNAPPAGQWFAEYALDLAR